MEFTVDQALQKGIEAHRTGKVQEADRYYSAILKANPRHPDANHNMGILAVDFGKVQEALPFFNAALKANPSIAQFWLSYIDALIKLDQLADAKEVFDQAKSTGAKGDAFDKLEKRFGSPKSTNLHDRDPTKEHLASLFTLYSQKKLHQVFENTETLTKRYTNNLTLWNLMGASAAQIGKLDEAVFAFQKAIRVEPDFADTYSNLGNVLKDLGKPKEAVEAFNKAVSLNPDFAEAYFNKGNVLKDQDRPEEAIEAYKDALSRKPNYAKAYNNMGNALKDQGKLEEAIEAYKKAISINPNNAEAFKNMGVVLKDQGNLKETLKAYSKAISIKPDYAEAHRNLSSIKKYTVEDKQFLQVEELYKREDLREDARCSLSFALAKMYEDIGKLDQSFSYLSEGNALRKKLLKYSINQDIELFTKLKKTQPHFLKNSKKIKESSMGPTPIFILGMPRSGTTLIEQIISSHSEVVGAGELKYVSQFGKNLAVDPTFINTGAISEFRDKYLSELSKVSYGQHFVTDKTPHNFLFIALICAAFPEAQIVHVQRNAAAICWSNYRQYFTAEGLGYCYDLRDVVSYYSLYIDLMEFWQTEYRDRIYNLNYEKLTTNQESETRKLIDLLGVDWEDACLSPHKNKRSVKTASNQQVRKKVYQGSSEAWRKYEPYLNGAFNSLPSS